DPRRRHGRRRLRSRGDGAAADCAAVERYFRRSLRRPISVHLIANIPQFDAGMRLPRMPPGRYSVVSHQATPPVRRTTHRIGASMMKTLLLTIGLALAAGPASAACTTASLAGAWRMV